MKKCLVLMSTYNGEKYLKEQLDSILNQQDIEVFIKISDDCSTDNTINIAEEYASKYKNIELAVNNKNKGYTYNFLDLIFSEKNSNYDYYALSDQDDYWLPSKLSNSINLIEKKEKEENKSQNGTIYSSNLKCVDEQLNYMYEFFNNKKILKKKKFNYMFENCAAGCTIVFNHKFLSHLTKYYPKKISIHDHWLLLVGLFSANFEYDDNSYILYRQHSNNSIGGKKSKNPFIKFKKLFHITFENDHNIIDINELILGFNEYISVKDKKTLNLILKYKKNVFVKIKFIIFMLFKSRGNAFFTKIILALKILFNRL